ncbi:MAG: hypothetical protein HQM03_17165 [Magnetococcales bacterium]|nr:hypothetical protein [Magnetococcales bacterium]
MPTEAPEDSLFDSGDFLLARAQELMRRFPGFAMICAITPLNDPWTVNKGFITPTLKPQRKRILEAFAEQVEGIACHQ